MLNKTTGFFLTFLVALCSIIYELIFSQVLTVGFGSTVERYSATIGLFLFSLGLGALLFNKIKIKSLYSLFIIVELLISIIGILGFLFILFFAQIHSLLFMSEAGQIFALVICHIPIILVGILSGIEIPLLTNLIGDKTFATVLGVDYFGSLFGSLLFGFFFYPKLGLYTTTLCVVSLNLAVVIVFAWQIKDKISQKLKLFCLSICITLLSVFAVLYAIESYLYKAYLQGILKKGFFMYLNMPSPDVHLRTYKRTKYTNIMKYVVNYADQQIICVNLDYHTQACDAWTKEYHQGLVDVPMSFFSENEKLSTLIVGGGDHIATQYLLKYRERVTKIDQVDIDKQFVEYSKTDGFFSKYHKNSFLSDKLNIVYTDGYNFLKNTNNTYDLVLMDLPGMYTDKTAHLYSVEFFSAVQAALKPKGMLITWYYPDRIAAKQKKVLFSTMAKAQFQYYTKFHSYRQYVSSNGEVQLGKVEKYFIIANTTDRFYMESPIFPDVLNNLYKKIRWQELNITTKVNGILFPNYDIVIRPLFEGAKMYKK